MALPKVAHVSTVDTGLRYLLLNQMVAIQRAGFQVCGISSPGPEVAAVEEAGIRHIPAPLTRAVKPLTDLAALWSLYRILRRERPTIVHTHTPKAALLGQYAALLARVPVRIHTIHGLYFPGHMRPERRWAYVLLERLTMLPSHMNLSQNPEDIPVAVAERICKPDRIRLLGNGVDLSLYDPSRYAAARRQRVRQHLGLSDSDKVVGMVGRFVAEKGYRELLEAARIVSDHVTNARFLFIGPVEPFKSDGLDPDIIRSMGLQSVVSFLGHRRDMVDLYAAMDLLALPSHREGFPRAPMEAAAMGVPSVVTDIRGCRQVVDDGVTGRLVPVRDPQALASALLELLTDDRRRRALGWAAHEKALREFDERAVFERVVATYLEMLRDRGHPLPGCQSAPT